MRLWVFMVLLWMGGLPVWAQQVDSLLSIARNYRAQNQYEPALKAYLKALRLLEDRKLPKADLQIELGDFYYKSRNYTQAIYYYLEGLKGLPKSATSEEINNLHEKLAAAYIEFKKYPEAINYLKKSLEYHTRLQNLNIISERLRTLVLAASQMGNYEAAKAYNERAVRTARRIGDSCQVAIALNNLAFSLNQLKEYREALENFRRAHQMLLKCQTDTALLVKVMTNIGINYQNMGDPHALKILKQAQSLAAQAKLEDEQAQIDLIVGSIHLQDGNLGTAEQYCRKAIVAFLKSQNYFQLRQAYLLLSEIQQASGDFQAAFESYKQYLQTADTLKGQEKIAQEQAAIYADLESKEREIQLILAREEATALELEKSVLTNESKQREIEFLKTRNLLSQVELEKRDLQAKQLANTLQLEKDKYQAAIREREIEKLEKEQLVARAEIENERKNRLLQKLENEKLQEEKKAAQKASEAQRLWTLLGIIAFVVTLFFFLVFLVFYFRDRQKNYQIAQTVAMLQQKNIEIEAKNREMTLINSKMSRKNLELELKKDELEKQKAKLEEAFEVLKRTQSQLVQAAKMASLGQLTAGIAHEINNPINFVSGNINPLRKDLSDIRALLMEVKKGQKTSSELAQLYREYDIDYLLEEIDQLAMGIEEGALRTKEIVAGLRNFSRLDEDTFKQADINEGINSTLALLRSAMRNKVEIHRDFGELPPVECLPGKLNQVFMNLLTNAIQAIEERGDIFITTKLVEDRVQISIRDTGHGMPPEVVERIFEPFFTTKDVGQGTGLGLSITYGIIQRHNGTIEVHSEPGKGTEFIIRIPIRHS